MHMKKIVSAILACVSLTQLSASTVPYPDDNKQPSAAKIDRAKGILSNNIISYKHGQPSFSISTEQGIYPASSFQVIQKSDSTPKKKPYSLSITYLNNDAGLSILWEASLADGDSYIKTSYSIKALKDIKLTKLQFIELPISGENEFIIPGTVPGTPLIDSKQRRFYGIENPVALANIGEKSATLGFDCQYPLKKGEQVEFNAVEGRYPEGQMRRGFLSYLERERALPYSLHLQYNCWYDHGLAPTEENMIATVKAYGEELVQKRGIKLDSFVLDDGWDDYNLDLWQPHPKKFPNGFDKLSKAIRDIDSNFGIWISPLGGYSGEQQRVAHAKRMKLMPESAPRMNLAHPGYRNWYYERCKELMEKDGVSFFKWDRAGDGVSPHFMNLLAIAGDLRKINPKVFFSTTVGTWPSPFWLNHIDCIWRTGTSDVNWIGKGSNREQYITYRDARAYSHIVKRAPLFPLNSLMHHGIVLGTQFQGLRTSDKRIYEQGAAKEPDANDGDFLGDTTKNPVNFPVNNDLKSDIRMLMGAGANQQELYLTTNMMNKQAWDDIAEAIRWSRQYADITADTHWVGGDPEQSAIYGYASWRGDKGATLALRNPSDVKKSIKLSIDIFEPTRQGDIKLQASYPDQRSKTLELPAKGEITLELEPFEVLIYSTRF